MRLRALVLVVSMAFLSGCAGLSISNPVCLFNCNVQNVKTD